jgi:hypothetical protein
VEGVEPTSREEQYGFIHRPRNGQRADDHEPTKPPRDSTVRDEETRGANRMSGQGEDPSRGLEGVEALKDRNPQGHGDRDERQPSNIKPHPSTSLGGSGIRRS